MSLNVVSDSYLQLKVNNDSVDDREKSASITSFNSSLKILNLSEFQSTSSIESFIVNKDSCNIESREHVTFIYL